MGSYVYFRRIVTKHSDILVHSTRRKYHDHMPLHIINFGKMLILSLDANRNINEFIIS